MKYLKNFNESNNYINIDIKSYFIDIIDDYDLYKVDEIQWRYLEDYNQYVEFKRDCGDKFEIGIYVKDDEKTNLKNIVIKNKDRINLTKSDHVSKEFMKEIGPPTPGIKDYINYLNKYFQLNEIYEGLFKMIYPDLFNKINSVIERIKIDYETSLYYDIKIINGNIAFFIIKIIVK